MKKQASVFILLLSLLYFFVYILSLIPTHLGCTLIFFAVFVCRVHSVKIWDICRTYAGDILEHSHVYNSKRVKRSESWSGLSPSGPHLSWGAEPRIGCVSADCHVHLTNCGLSIISGMFASFPTAFSAQLAVCSISQIIHYRPHLAVYFQCCTCDDACSYTNAWSFMLSYKL